MREPYRSWVAAIAIAALGCGQEKSNAGRAPDGGAQGGVGATGGAGTAGTTASTGGMGGADASTTLGPDGGVLAELRGCEPAAERWTPQDRTSLDRETCGSREQGASGLPNTGALFMEDFPLTTPLTPGVPFAMSFDPPRNSTRGSIEIWGTEVPCVPDELLWFGDMQDGVQCVDFMPTRSHSRLQFVTRMLEPTAFFEAGVGTLALCPSGSCSNGSDGHPLSPGVVLDPPVGLYELICYSTTGGHECIIGRSGLALLVDDEARSDEETDLFHPVRAGAFRLPSTDPFGDAWYCVGAGSDLEETTDDSRTDIRIRDITQLPACSEGNESASFNWSSGFTTDVTSSLAELAATGVSIRARCSLDSCRFRFTGSATTTYLYVTLDASVDGLTAPTELSVVDASWFSVPVGSLVVRRTCATSGTVQYDPNGASTLQLDRLSPFIACPGGPASTDTLYIVGE